MTLRKLFDKAAITALVLTFLGSLSAYALPADYYASTSVLAKGKWVKIKVPETGIYEITFDELRSLGFSEPEKVAVYGFSPSVLRAWNFDRKLPDDLPGVPTMLSADKMLFYGVANSEPTSFSRGSSYPGMHLTQLDRSLYDDCSYYYLTDSQPRVEMPVADTTETAGLEPMTKGQGMYFKEFFESRPGSTGVFIFSRDFLNDGKLDVDLPLPGYTPANGTATLFAGVASCVTQGRITPVIDGVTMYSTNLYTYSGSRGYTVYNYQNLTTSLYDLPANDSGTYKLELKLSNISGGYFAGIDFVAISYPSTTDLAYAPCRLMAFPSAKKGQKVQLYNVNPGSKVWSISANRATELPLTPGEAEGEASFISPADYSRIDPAYSKAMALRTFIFDPASTQLRPEIVGEVRNQNLHAMKVPQMLIVSSDVCMEQARRLASLHATHTGLDVAVVPYSQVCEEFSSGTSHPVAIRRMAKMLYDRDPGRFKAVLIFGRAHSDNTGNTTVYSQEEFESKFIPMFSIEDIYNCGEQPTAYASDALYAMLDDDFVFDYRMTKGHVYLAPLTINVGRIPAIDAEEARVYVDKVEKYLNTPWDAPVFNRAVMTADLGDENTHLDEAMMVRELVDELSPSTVMDMHLQSVYNPYNGSHPAMRARLTTQLQRGVGIWFFLGHSNSGKSISTNGFWGIADDASVVTNYPPLTVFGTCHTMEIDSPTETLQVSQLFNPTGGSIASIGAVRPSYASHNHTICLQAAHGYYKQAPDATFGDVLRLGRQAFLDDPESFSPSYSSNTINAANLLHYNFAGDPMLPMRGPSRQVKITAWNSEPVPAKVNVDPLDTQLVEGVVCDSEGNVDTSFNGTMTMLVYDGRHTVDTRQNADSDNPLTEISLDETLLQEVKFDVVGGRFSRNVTFAMGSYSGQGNRLTMHAVTSDRSRSAVGALDGFSISLSPSESAASLEAPEITAMFADSEDHDENETLPANFMVYATVAPSQTDLLGSSDRFGGAMSLVVDNGQSLTGVDGFVSINTDGSASLAYPVTELTDGPHTLTFTIKNVAGLSSSRSINVNVVNVGQGATTVSAPFVREEAVIGIDHNLSEETAGRLVITDVAGKTVFAQGNTSFPFTWSLVDSEGTDVADGIYTARVYFKAGRQYGFAAPVSFVVGR